MAISVDVRRHDRIHRITRGYAGIDGGIGTENSAAVVGKNRKRGRIIIDADQGRSSTAVEVCRNHRNRIEADDTSGIGTKTAAAIVREHRERVAIVIR